MTNSELPVSAHNPILLDNGHHLTRLIVTDAHKRVLHSGVKETLTEVRSSFWIVRGRQFVQSIIHECVVCYQSVQPLPLPDYRVRQSRPCQFTGVDFTGPLYIKSADEAERPKVWLCLYTCAVTRAVH